MVDVRDLEKRWVKYKIKKYSPYVVLLISIILISVIGLNILSSKEELASAKPEKSLPAPKKPAQEQASVTQKRNVSKESTQTPVKIEQNISTTQVAQLQTVQTPNQLQSSPKRNRSNVMKPSLDFLKKMKDNSVVPTVPSQEEYSHHNTSANVKRSESRTSSSANKQLASSDTQEQEEENNRHTKPKIKIEIKKTTEKEIEDIIKRFKKTNNPVLSLFIAKKYYELGNYHKSYNYALITNQIDSTIEDSWIIFAKSLVKLGQKERAVKTLEAYIKTSSSNKAKILLDNIKLGKFK